jgi:hypothetical protein
LFIWKKAPTIMMEPMMASRLMASLRPSFSRVYSNQVLNDEPREQGKKRR